MDADDDLFDAKVTVLGEYVARHVQEENENKISAARKAAVDLKQLGAELHTRKEEWGDEAETEEA